MALSDSLSLVLNQSSLQDFLDCPRRFELRIINNTAWPSEISSPIMKFENLTELGNRFHQLCHQYFIGIESALLTSTITDPELLDLWNKFLPYGETLENYPNFPELTLRIPIHNHYLVAKYDLILRLSDDDYLIIDWKTSKKKPSRTLLGNRVQSLLYPYIFQQAGSELFSVVDIPASAIKLQYWYPNAEDPEEVFPYSEVIHQEVEQTVTSLIDQIDQAVLSGDNFPLTDNLEQCEYCAYRSLCDRGHRFSPLPAGADLESEDLSNTHFDFDVINEVEY